MDDEFLDVLRTIAEAKPTDRLPPASPLGIIQPLARAILDLRARVAELEGKL